MRTRRVLVSLAAAGALAGAVPSMAASTAKPSSGPYVSTYLDSACDQSPAPARCDVIASWASTVTPGGVTGLLTAHEEIDRTDPSGSDAVDEATSAGRVIQPVKLPAGVHAATITYRWHVSSASSSATNSVGFGYAGSWIYAGAVCGTSCTVDDDGKQVTLACAREGAPATSCTLPCTITATDDDLNPVLPPSATCEDAYATEVSDIDVLVTVSVSNVKGSFNSYSYALAYGGGYAACFKYDPQPNPDGSYTCEVYMDLDHQHDGDETSDLTAYVKSITVTPTV